jgi:hypothetical protein
MTPFMEIENKEKDIFILEWPPLRRLRTRRGLTILEWLPYEGREQGEAYSHSRMTPLRGGREEGEAYTVKIG